MDNYEVTDNKHLSITSMCDVTYKNYGKEFIAIPGQAFPIYNIAKGVVPHAARMWLYTAVSNSSEKLWMDDNQFYRLSELPFNTWTGSPIGNLGRPGGIQVIHATFGMPGLTSRRSVDDFRRAIHNYPLPAGVFYKLNEMANSATTTLHKRLMPCIFAELNSTMDKIYPDHRKMQMWVPVDRKWYTLGTEFMKKVDVVRLDMPVMMTPLEDLLDARKLPYSRPHDQAITTYMRMLSEFRYRTGAEMLYLGHLTENLFADCSELVTRQEYDFLKPDPDRCKNHRLKRKRTLEGLDSKTPLLDLEDDYGLIKRVFSSKSFLPPETLSWNHL